MRQVTGIAIVMGGLLAFIVLHQRGDPANRSSHRRKRSSRSEPRARRRESTTSFAYAICFTTRESVRSSSAMKCEADLHAPVGGRAQGRCSGGVAPHAAIRARASRAKTSTGASSLSRALSRMVASLCSAPETPSSASSAASRHSLSAACSPPRRLGARRSPIRVPRVPVPSVRVHAGRAPGVRGRGPRGVRRRWPRPFRSPAPACWRRPRSHRPGTARGRSWKAGTPLSAGTQAVPTFRPRERGAGQRRRSDARSGRARQGSRPAGHGATGRRPNATNDRPGRKPQQHGRGRQPRWRLGRRRASSRLDPTAGRARRRACWRDRSAPSLHPTSPWCERT